MILKTNPETIAQAAQLIQQGEVVAFPTETVYGLGADATNATAVSKIFSIKGRPSDNPLIVHCGHKNDIPTYGTVRFALEQKVIDTLMPGPLTIILPHKNNLPDIVTAGLPTVAIRIPDHVTAIQLIRKAGVALAAPSANLSGKPSPTSASMVEHDIGDKVPMIIDGESCIVGIESTVIKVIDEETIMILRPGFITREDLIDATGEKVEYATKDLEQSPGTRYKHYAPKAKIFIIETLDERLIEILLEQGENIGLIATKEFLSGHKEVVNKFTKRENNEDEVDHKDKGQSKINTEEEIQNEDLELGTKLQPITTFPRGSHMKLLECAQSLYNLYHQCDKLNMSTILIENLPEKGLGYAIMNRVKKSIGA